MATEMAFALRFPWFPRCGEASDFGFENPVVLTSYGSRNRHGACAPTARLCCSPTYSGLAPCDKSPNWFSPDPETRSGNTFGPNGLGSTHEFCRRASIVNSSLRYDQANSNCHRNMAGRKIIDSVIPVRHLHVDLL